MVATTPETRRDTPFTGFAGDAADGRRWLAQSGRFLVGALLFAQWVFVAYLLASYGRSTMRGDMVAWSRFSAKGWLPGDTVGNAAMAVHLLVALLVLVAGALQVTPWVRRRVPVVHRWSGRLYLLGCLLGAMSGLVLVWGRSTVGDRSQHVAISINAALLTVCAIMAWRAARARDFVTHQRWALRTFFTAGGVLYFRLFLALWLMVFRAPVGFDARTFSGPFLTVLAFGVYVFGPLLLYEAYRAAMRSAQRFVHVGTSVILYAVALVVIAGSLAALLVLWLPRLGTA